MTSPAAPSPALTLTLSLPRSTPAEQGVDPGGISGLLDALESAAVEMHSLMVLRHGQVVAEGWWAPYEPSGLHLLYSLSKSFTSTAVGLAVHEGLLGVDDLVTSFFPDQVPSHVSSSTAKLTVRDLLSMATGHREDTLDRMDRNHLVSSFLALAPEEEPGAWFTYNNGATLMLSAIVTRLTGERVLDYLRPRLLDPLGIAEANWQGVDSLDYGFSGLHLPTEAIAKLGQLYLQHGRWQGVQLVPEAWVAEATRTQVENPREPNPDWRQGYGYQFWMARHGYRGDGAFGQFCLVLEEQDAVVAITAAAADMQSVLDCVWSSLLPALGAEAGPATEAEALTARLGRLTLPLGLGGRSTPATVDLPFSTVQSAAKASGARVDVTGIEESGDGWRLTLADQFATYEVGCGYQSWTRSECDVWPGARLQVAASGGWTGPTTFTAEVAMVQTPHRLTLVCDVASGLTTASWNVAPLGPTSASPLALDLARG